MSSFLKIKDLEQQVLKLIDCADYQCCEHDGWFDSTSYNFLCSLRDQIQSKQFSNTQDKQSTVYDSLYWEWNLSDAHCAVVEYPNGDRALIFEEKTYEEHLKEHQARLVAYYGNLSQAQGAKKYPRIILLLFLLEHQTPSTIARAVSLINQYRQDKILGQNNCQLLNELKHCRQRLQETKKRF